nr:MAG TPA: Protein of unknown function (DUF1043) [Caudoviricetes sp.]
MSNMPEGQVTVAAKVFWRTRQFWIPAIAVILSAILIGYLIGNWTAATGAKEVLAQQERAYKEASDARKAVLQQCLVTNEANSKRLAELGNKTADALNKVATDE